MTQNGQFSANMSKRALKKYLGELKPDALREQLLDLHDRFPEVREYYKFVFNPNEDILLRQAQEKIREEYFPKRRKKAKARRSVAKNLIRHFETLEVSPTVMAELMAYNVNTAADYEPTRNCPDSFYKSIGVSFKQWVAHVHYHRINREFTQPIQDFMQKAEDRQWPNLEYLEDVLEQAESF